MHILAISLISTVYSACTESSKHIAWGSFFFQGAPKSINERPIISLSDVLSELKVGSEDPSIFEAEHLLPPTAAVALIYKALFRHFSEAMGFKLECGLDEIRGFIHDEESLLQDSYEKDYFRLSISCSCNLPLKTCIDSTVYNLSSEAEIFKLRKIAHKILPPP